MSEYNIKLYDEHYAVYDKDGQIILHDDTYELARQSLIEYLSEQ